MFEPCTRHRAATKGSGCVAPGRLLLTILAAAALAPSQPAANDLQQAISLTTRGQFQEAIPHFLAARRQLPNSFALEFNLALCYTGTRQFPEAIRILQQLTDSRRAAEVKNLLAQAFIGDHRPEAAKKAFEEAAAAAPTSEKLYVLVSQASMDEGFPDLAHQVLEAGLRNLPDSAKLHFQQAVLDSQQDDHEAAAREFQAAQKLAPGSEIAYIAEAEQALYEGRMHDVIRVAREGIQKGYQHYLLLTMLGEALLRSGATPDTPAEFHEAQAMLEKAVAAKPGYSSSHIALGRVYLAQGRAAEAVTQLELARQLGPHDRAVYPPLAAAYQRSGHPEKAKEALSTLAALNKDDAERIRTSDGGHAGYVTGKKTP